MNTQQYILMTRLEYEALQLFCKKQRDKVLTWTHSTYDKDLELYRVFIDYNAPANKIRFGYPELHSHHLMQIGTYVGMAIQRYNKHLQQFSDFNIKSL